MRFSDIWRYTVSVSTATGRRSCGHSHAADSPCQSAATQQQGAVKPTVHAFKPGIAPRRRNPVCARAASCAPLAPAYEHMRNITINEHAGRAPQRCYLIVNESTCLWNIDEAAPLQSNASAHHQVCMAMARWQLHSEAQCNCQQSPAATPLHDHCQAPSPAAAADTRSCKHARRP